MRRTLAGALMIALAVLVASCATGRSYARGDAAGKAGDWEAAVGFYRQAVQDDPDRPDYKIALERAMLQAAAMFVDRAKQFEAAGQPEEALRAYRKAQEFEPANRQVATWAGDLERSIRDKLEAAAVRPEIDKLREQARRASAEPLLNPASRDLLGVHFTNAGIRDVLNFIGASTGINVTYDRDFQDRSITVNLEGVTLEQALQQIMVANVLFYKVLNERTIIVAADTTQKRTQYEEQVIRTFFISHSDATELSQLLVAVVRVAGMAIQPQIVANKTSNTVTVRATGPVVQIIERLIEVNDKPRAEIMVDVQILEVSRERTKKYGLNLSNYQISGAFSPESTPDKTTPFNLNTISKGVSTADFYMALPTAIVNFLESDSQTKVLAKPNIRASEGQKVALNLGEDVPIPSTTFTPIATGGPSTNPLVSFGYRTIGIIVEMEPRVTYEGDIILNVSIENSARGSDSNIAGQNLPSFFSRKVQTRLRLRDGESNLLAGLLRDDERKSLNGFPGVMRLPIVKQLFSNNDNTIKQTDIVMLITPRIIRTHELKALDLSPIYIGTQANMALGGPPPLIGGDAAAAAAPGLTPGVAPSPALSPAGIPAAVPAPAGTQPPTTPALPAGSSARPTIPPGSSPIPGMVGVPPAQPAAAPNPITVFSPPEPPPPAPTPAPAPATAQPAPAAPAAPVAPPQAPPGAAPPAPAPAAPVVGTARVTLSPPSEMRVGSGPYTIPVSVTGASRMSTITLSITYNPTLVRVRSVQEGTFMRQGGVTPAFTSQTDDKAGRIDIAVTRPGDQTGASTSGLLAAILLEPLAPGTGSLTVTGTAAIPGGTPAGLQFAPATITVK